MPPGWWDAAVTGVVTAVIAREPTASRATNPRRHANRVLAIKNDDHALNGRSLEPDAV